MSKFDNFTATQILREIEFWCRYSKGSKMSFLAILEVLNFDFSKFEELSSSEFTKNSKFRVSKIVKNDIFGPFEFDKIGFHAKPGWRYCQISTKSILNFTF